MSATAFDTVDYWMERGKSYIGEAGRLRTQFYRDQEQFFCDAVKDFKPNTILEVGCGFGRLTASMRFALPGVNIVAFDVSPDQVTNAKRYCVNDPKIDFRCGDVMSLPEAKADIAVACEVFLHLPDVAGAITKLLDAAPVAVHDYDPAVKPGDRTGPHCFAHDYERIYSDLGLSFVRRIRGEHGLMVVQRA